MLGAGDACGAQEGIDEARIIPAGHGVNIVAPIAARLALEPLQQLRDAALGQLELVRHADAVVVVPDAEDHWPAEHARGVDGFPEHAFGTARVADRAEGDLVAVVRERRERGQFWKLPVELRGVSKADEPGHLRAGRRDVGGAVHDPGQILPPAVPVEEARGKVGVHRPPAGHRLKLRVGVGVKLSEEFLDGMQAQGEQ